MESAGGRINQATEVRGELRSSKDTKKRVAILQGVRTLVESGKRFTDISVSDIVQAAGVSRSTFYLHFSDKRALIELLIDKLEVDLMTAAGLVEGVFTNRTEDELRQSLVDLAQYVRSNLAVFAAVNEMAATDPDIHARYHDMICATVTPNNRIIAERKKSGLVDPKLEDFVPTAITWMVERSITQHITTKTHATITKDKTAMKVVNGLAQVVWNALHGLP